MLHTYAHISVKFLFAYWSMCESSGGCFVHFTDNTWQVPQRRHVNSDKRWQKNVYVPHETVIEHADDTCLLQWYETIVVHKLWKTDCEWKAEFCELEILWDMEEKQITQCICFAVKIDLNIEEMSLLRIQSSTI
jgi:hypothetical protein